MSCVDLVNALRAVLLLREINGCHRPKQRPDTVLLNLFRAHKTDNAKDHHRISVTAASVTAAL